MNSKQYGAKPGPDHIKRYERSRNWANGKFQNLQQTTMGISPLKIPEIIYKQISVRTNGTPKNQLPVTALDKEKFMSPSDHIKMVWYGHSAMMMRVKDQTILIDPMLGPDASPIGPFRTKRYSNDTLDLIDTLPDIDLMLITHDHYDHLDLASIDKLKTKTKRYFVALGLKRHLVKWKVDPDRIIEFDWWDSHQHEDISLTFTPSRHFSGRGLKDRAKCLWGGWVIDSATERIWFSGDGGYGPHFKDIGERLGPFDFGLMECGQYNENWAQIHMFPEESVQAAIDGRVDKAMPVHWGAFTLAPHRWTDPVERFIVSAVEHKLHFTLPRLGEVFTKERSTAARWWHQ